MSVNQKEFGASSFAPTSDQILFCLIGPSGAGKGALGTKLLTEFADRLGVSISATTREPRKGELEGAHYFFVDQAEFERQVAAGDFLEWEQVHGNLYGTLRSQVEQQFKDGRSLLFDIDIRGAFSIKRHYPEQTVIVLILPPSIEELSRRITGRSPISVSELEHRLKTAAREIELIREGWQSIDYYLINEDLVRSEETIRSILVAEWSKLERGRGVGKLLGDIANDLAGLITRD